MISAYLLHPSAERIHALRAIKQLVVLGILKLGSTQALSTREALEGQALSKQKELMCLLKLPMDTEDNQILYYHLILIPSK